MGANFLGELIDIGVDMDLVKKSGAWYSYQDSKIGQGRNNAIRFLEENPAIAQEIEAKIRAEKFADVPTVNEAEDTEDEVLVDES